MNTTIIVLVAYLLFIFVLAAWLSRQESLRSYFLNENNTGLWLFTFSNVATVLGAGATVAIVAEVYRTGISYGLALPISFIIGMIIMGLVAEKIRKFGEKHNAHTIVDFFHNRFGAKNRVLSGILQIFLLTIWTAAQAVAIASLASVLVGVNYNLALFIAAGVTVLYTAVGGLKIDLISDFIQFWVIFIMFAIMAFIGYQDVGSFSNLFAQLPSGHLDPFAFGGVSWFVGVILLSGFIYIGNSGHWQRLYSTKDPETAQKGFFWALPFLAVLSTLVLFLGLVAAVTLSEVSGEQAIFQLMETTLPPALVGVGFASVLAVIMSSIDSWLVAGSTILYRSVFKYRESTDSKNVLYARGITALFGTFGFLLAFLIPNIVTLSLVNTYLVLIFVPSIFAGLYSDNFSSEAVFYSLLIPTIVLFSTYHFVGENTFLITTPLSIAILFGYNWVASVYRKNIGR